MKAVILAAGKGVRLRPITSTRPKHLISVGGRPILEHCLNGLKENKIKDILMVVHYMADTIRNHFGEGEGFGLRIKYIDQESVLGTANAVGVAEPYIDDNFLVAYGDLLFSADVVRKAIDLHEKDKPEATMTVVPIENPEEY